MKTLLILAAISCFSPRAVDGDTLACDTGERIRIWGINAPERHDPGGPQATAYMRSLIHGKLVICEPKGHDRYRRIVALCRTNGHDLADRMVHSGNATDWPRYSGGYYALPAKSKDQPK